MITLITGQPGNGKTALAVYHYLYPESKERIVYTVGIPKLTIPTVPMTRSELTHWHECEPKINPEDDDEIPLLRNITEGSLVVIDEVQKSWKPAGTHTSPDIEYLSEHRHHGLDFVVMTQFPHLVHKTIRALATKHIHIRSTWKGRSLNEWPDWQENPQTKSALQNAVKTNYKIPREVYSMYESASIHTVVKHKTPWQYFAIIGAFILVPVLAYASVKRIYDHTKTVKSDTPIKHPISSVVNADLSPKSDEVQPSQNSSTVRFEYVGVVSPQYDWSKVAACMVMHDECRCYGDDADRLVIPDPVCRSAIVNGWAGRPKPQIASNAPTTTRNEEAEKQGAVVKPTLDTSHAAGMSGSLSPTF